ncbi:MAG: hypothetical protein L0I24_00200 [Pseudonocardia sp.]|nr:hypothetical protein [Pseudonocardia sp.]
MSTISVVSEALAAALRTVPGVRVWTDLHSPIDPPGVVLGPPALTWSSYTADPTTGRFLAYVVVPADGRALTALWDLVPLVAAAVDTVQDAVVLRADPANFSGGSADLPAYMIEIEVSL